MQNDPIAESAMATLLARHPALAACADKITDAYRILRDSIAQGGTVFVCGNGGSHAMKNVEDEPLVFLAVVVGY